MFAIIQSGGKQYRVAPGDVVQLESLKAEPGDTVDLPVMMLGGDTPKVGTPLLSGESVKAEVISHGKGKKIYIRKFKAKANYRRTTGHRQNYTEVRITDVAGTKAAKTAAKPEPVKAVDTNQDTTQDTAGEEE